ncbi:hypothetical protein [Maribacter thermophilus]|uniref:hypothetical protein n=1 Tax=Maribacter thermophilus TaxID=1197874 RepID=UPI000640D437|nr:hypothetical protein [Maribacter thermophilus]
MKKITGLLGIGLLGALLISFTGFDKTSNKEDHGSVDFLEEIHNPFAEGLRMEMESANMKADDLVLVEEEEEIVLGFDTADYLPFGFNAYKGMEVDPDDIIVLEEEEEVELGFDVAPYLPENFDAFAK